MIVLLRSYLPNRFQYVRVANDCSSKYKLACGVPQRSVLGPILYFLYMALIADIIKHHGVGFYFYIDDMQIFICHLILQIQTSELISEGNHGLCENSKQSFFKAFSVKGNWIYWGPRWTAIGRKTARTTLETLHSRSFAFDLRHSSNTALLQPFKQSYAWQEVFYTLCTLVYNYCDFNYGH